MRSSKSRSRSKQNRPRTIGNIINRVFDSSGPEGKVRGTPQQIIEKYQMLSRDAQLSNDRVAAENFSQHAEHYTRLLAEAQREMAAEQEARQQQYSQNGNQNGQNGNSQNGNGQNAAGGQNGNRDDNRRDFRNERDNRDNRPWRDERSVDAGAGDQPDIPVVIDSRAEHESGLVETPEARAPRSEEPLEARREDRPRRATEGERPQSNRNREEGQNREGQNRRERGPRPPRSDRPAAVAPQEAAVAAQSHPDPAPLVAVPDAAAAETAGQSAPVTQSGEAAAKPRRPRAPRKPKEAGASDADPGTGGPREAAE
jgi:hypothetical protein